mmetsp:Transcript_19248/g.45881  ORF Transcript_19248/g.45881 Transcript_19248/m.45881 type:complete len:172 (+) Transcript_19248:384-899(+)
MSFLRVSWPIWPVLIVLSFVAEGVCSTSRAPPLVGDLVSRGRSLTSQGCILTEQRCLTVRSGSAAVAAFEGNCDSSLQISGVDVLLSLSQPSCGWRQWLQLNASWRQLRISTECLSSGYYFLSISFSDGSNLLLDLYVWDNLLTPSTLCELAKDGARSSGALNGWSICSCI